VKKSIGAKTVVYPTPVFIVGSYDADGKPNVMTAAWGGICCSQPPCVAFSLRESRYSYGNIVNRGAFTISIPAEEHAPAADFFGIVSGRQVDKFAATGLTPVRGEFVDAPYVGEFPFALECRLLDTVELGTHIQFIGEILDIKADESALDEKGNLDIEKVRPILFAPGNGAYYGVGAFVAAAFSVGKQFSREESGE
jgi:flavin reductase (DIM6/NTAB) family NADH-FMN oxidoreductase RutF